MTDTLKGDGSMMRFERIDGGTYTYTIYKLYVGDACYGYYKESELPDVLKRCEDTLSTHNVPDYVGDREAYLCWIDDLAKLIKSTINQINKQIMFDI